MRWMKAPLAALLLCLLTAGVILLPPVWDARAGTRTEHAGWEYDAGTAAKITDREVARLYCGGELDPYNLTGSDKTDGEYRQESRDMLERALGSSGRLLQALTQVVNDGSLNDCREKTPVILWNDRPLALRLVEVSYLTEDTYLHLCFETRTYTLLFLESNVTGLDFSELQETANAYFADELGLEALQYSSDDSEEAYTGKHFFADQKDGYYWSMWLQWYSDVEREIF